MLCFLLAACSSTTFVYNRLDFLLPWYLERYVDLDRAQAAELDAALEPLLTWHRNEELPRYIELLEAMEAELDRPLSMQTVALYSDRMELAWYRLRDTMLDELLELATELSDEQIAEFIESLEKKQRKYERKYLERGEAEFREDAYDNLRESVEDYLGRLDVPQRQRIQQAADDIWRSDATWLQQRGRWIAVLSGQLERQPGWQARVRSTVRDWESELDAQTVTLYDHNTETVQRALVDVLNQRNERQDQRLRAKLQELAEDLATLSKPDR